MLLRPSRLCTWPPLACVATLTIAMGAVYLLAVRTQWGQYLDQQAYLTLLGTGASADLPHMVGLGSITDYRLWTVAAALIIGLGFVAGRCWSLLPLLLLPIAGILLAQFMRDEVLLRPDFVGDAWLSNTFPSGHAAAAAGCVAAIVRAAPRRVAPVLAILGVGWLTLVGQDLMVWGWHRPSDLIGSILLATALMHLVPPTRRHTYELGGRTVSGVRAGVWTAAAAATGPVVWSVGTGMWRCCRWDSSRQLPWRHLLPMVVRLSVAGLAVSQSAPTTSASNRPAIPVLSNITTAGPPPA